MRLLYVHIPESHHQAVDRGTRREGEDKEDRGSFMRPIKFYLVCVFFTAFYIDLLYVNKTLSIF